MRERTIMIFPEFQNGQMIDRIRTQYDPLAQLVKPHITLVFPFRSEMTNQELASLIQERISGFGTFSLVLQGISMHQDQRGNYLFLNIKDGEEQIRAIHERLYQGELGRFQTAEPYQPHMTVGNLSTPEAMELAYFKYRNLTECYETTIKEIAVEEIEPDESSHIILHQCI